MKHICIYNEQFKDNVYLLLFITNRCNYRCSYCYNEKVNSIIDINLENLKLFISNIRAQNNKKIFVNLIGGEPTLYTKLFELTNFLKDIDNLETSIFTNLSQSENFYKQLIATNVFITASFHDNSFITVDEFIEKIKFINNQNMLKDVIVLYNTKSEKSLECYSKILKMSGNFNKELDLIDGMIYSKQQLELFNKYKNNNTKNFIYCENDKRCILSFDEISKNFKFKNWICNAGKTLLYVHANGNIYKCESSYSEKQIPIGNININPYFMLKKHASLCNCIKCSGDYGIYKEKVFMYNI